MTDFQLVFHRSVFEIGETLTWIEAWCFIQHLLVTPGTYLHMKENNWSYPMSLELSAMWDNTETIANQNRQQGQKPVEMYERPNAPKKEVLAGTPVSFEMAKELYGI